jgi:hypothetical protein
MLNQETRAPRLRVYGADHTRRHPTSQSSGHRVPDLCDHPRSSAPGLLLLPRSSSLHAMPHLLVAHHETSKHDSPNKTKIKDKQNELSRFEFKPRHVNDSSQLNQGTDNLVSLLPTPLLNSAEWPAGPASVSLLNITIEAVHLIQISIDEQVTSVYWAHITSM